MTNKTSTDAYVQRYRREELAIRILIGLFVVVFGLPAVGVAAWAVWSIFLHFALGVI